MNSRIYSQPSLQTYRTKAKVCPRPTPNLGSSTLFSFSFIYFAAYRPACLPSGLLDWQFTYDIRHLHRLNHYRWLSMNERVTELLSTWMN